MIFKLLLTFTLIFLIFLGFNAHAQDLNVTQLEETVFKYNNRLKFTDSQALLLPLIEDEKLSPDYKYEAAILLSYTYKRVFDYQSTLKFLDTALKFANLSKKKQVFRARILSEQAFVHFDTHNYVRADSIMLLLAKSHFVYIDLENKSKLVMQQGYLYFLGKQFQKADSCYNLAIGWMKTSNPCNLPMIFVKKMQLYDAMDRADLMDEAFDKSSFYADSCKIIKYSIYANDELLDIYHKRKNLSKMAVTKRILDSLNKIYSREENIVSLHNQKENILLEYKEKQIQKAQTDKQILFYLLIISFTTATFFFIFLLFFYRQKDKSVDQEASNLLPDFEQPISLQEKISGLSERQSQILGLLAEGVSNKIIADKLCISENTVKYHIKNIYHLLGVNDRKEIVIHFKKQP